MGSLRSLRKHRNGISIDKYENESVEKWEKDGLRFYLLKVDLNSTFMKPYYCGYARFSERPVKEGSILSYVPVHGGITLEQTDDQGGMIYGFDCAHASDFEDPRTRDIGWLKEECERMARAIIIASEYEDEYLAASAEEKADILDKYEKAVETLL
jgi:hypothetical protein